MKHQNQIMLDFEGITYRRGLDQRRLNSQLDNVKQILERGHWYTLREIANQTGYPEASISARIRDLRKPHKFGLLIERRRKPGCEERGIFQYRMARKPTGSYS